MPSRYYILLYYGYTSRGDRRSKSGRPNMGIRREYITYTPWPQTEVDHPHPLPEQTIIQSPYFYTCIVNIYDMFIVFRWIPESYGRLRRPKMNKKHSFYTRSEGIENTNKNVLGIVPICRNNTSHESTTPYSLRFVTSSIILFISHII